jgi:hypothetical protein
MSPRVDMDDFSLFVYKSPCHVGIQLLCSTSLNFPVFTS